MFRILRLSAALISKHSIKPHVSSIWSWLLRHERWVYQAAPECTIIKHSMLHGAGMEVSRWSEGGWLTGVAQQVTGGRWLAVFHASVVISLQREKVFSDPVKEFRVTFQCFDKIEKLISYCKAPFKTKVQSASQQQNKNRIKWQM